MTATSEELIDPQVIDARVRAAIEQTEAEIARHRDVRDNANHAIRDLRERLAELRRRLPRKPRAKKGAVA